MSTKENGGLYEDHVITGEHSKIQNLVKTQKREGWGVREWSKGKNLVKLKERLASKIKRKKERNRQRGRERATERDKSERRCH